MRLLDIKLVNYCGIKNGTKLNEIFIDLRKCKNNILLIRGRNGGGKSTLMNAMSPFPESSDSFLPCEPAYKELTYLVEGIEYHIYFEHGFHNGKRQTPKAFIQKMTPTGPIELNPTGNITSYKSVIETEFELDPNFITLSNLSNDNKGIVEKTPSERLKYVMVGMKDLSIYNNINKTLSKRESVFKSLVNNIVSKIESIGNEEILKSNLESINNRLSVIDSRLETLKCKISECNATISIYDADGAIQNSYNQANDMYNTLSNRKYMNNSNINKFLKTSKVYNSIDDLDIKSCESLFNEVFNSINSVKEYIELKQKEINNKIIDRDEDFRTVNLKISKLDNLKSEFNFDYIKNSIKICGEKIREYETLFNDIGIKNAISITKDEYITGLNVMKELVHSIEAYSSDMYSDEINEAINSYILANKSPANEILSLTESIDSNNELKSKIESRINYLEGLIDRLSILEKRPKECNIDSCSFIKNALEIQKAQPEIELNKLGNELLVISDKIEKEKLRLKRLSNINQFIKNILTINRTVENNINILNKLPNGYIFTNKNELYKRIINSSTFNEIYSILDSIKYANAFEDYKAKKEQLYKLNTEYKIYESKNEIIEEISSDIDRINSNIDSITTEINTLKNEVASNEIKLKKYNIILEELNIIIPILKDNENINTEIKVCIDKMNAISENMNKINKLIKDIETLKAEVNNLENQKKPLTDSKESILYSLKQLEEYNKELAEYSESYDIVRKLKRYSNPSKQGIQQMFIKLYMSQTIKISNSLLSTMFNGRLELLDCIIGESSFSIPVYSHDTGMVVDDISSCSTSEKCMSSMILGVTLMNQASLVYNILKLDEIDFGLDSVNRLMFANILENIRVKFGIEQIIMTSHSLEMDKGSVDIIQLEKPLDENLEEDNGNIIFHL